MVIFAWIGILGWHGALIYGRMLVPKAILFGVVFIGQGRIPWMLLCKVIFLQVVIIGCSRSHVSSTWFFSTSKVDSDMRKTLCHHQSVHPINQRFCMLYKNLLHVLYQSSLLVVHSVMFMHFLHLSNLYAGPMRHGQERSYLWCQLMQHVGQIQHCRSIKLTKHRYASRKQSNIFCKS